ncbi:MAG: 6-carboxytetrahydropterin synthase QueD [Bacteroidota bacterium]
MAKIRITKQFTFETAHALHGYDGKCRNIHGHSYKLDVTVLGEPIAEPKSAKRGMVIDFGDLKKIVKTEIVDIWDHAIILNRETPHIKLAEELKSTGHNVVLVDYQPTSEKMIEDFAQKIIAKLPEDITLHSLKLRETETAFAEWYASDNS